MDAKKVKEILENHKNKPNKDLVEVMDFLSGDFDKTKELIGKKAKERYENGFVSPFLGKKLSEERVLSMSKEFCVVSPDGEVIKGINQTEFCRKNSEARKGKFLLGENNNAKKVVDLQTNIIYDSAKEVSLKFNINYSTLKSYLNNRLFYKTNFKYLNKCKQTHSFMSN